MQDTQYGLKVTISVPYELAVQRATALKTEGLPVTRRKTRPWPMRPNERGATMPTWSSLTQPERLTAATPFSFCAFVHGTAVGRDRRRPLDRRAGALRDGAARVHCGVKQLAEASDRGCAADHAQVVLWTLTFTAFVWSGVMALCGVRWTRGIAGFVAAAAVFQLRTLRQPPLPIGAAAAALVWAILLVRPARTRRA